MVHNNWLYREAENPDDNLAGAGVLDQESAALSLVRIHMVPHSMPQDYYDSHYKPYAHTLPLLTKHHSMAKT